MRRRDLSRALLASAGTLALESSAAQPSARGVPLGARTRAEVDAGVTVVDGSFPAYPYIDPRRYGADPSGTSDSTRALQAALDVAYRCKGMVWIGNGCSYRCGALSLIVDGNRNTDGLHIMGSSVGGSRLIQHGSPEAMLTIRGQDPADHPQEFPLVLENLSIACSGRTTDAIVLHGVGSWTLRKVYVAGARRAVWLHFALTGLIEDCWFTAGAVGVYASAEGPAAGSYLVLLRHSVIDAHSSWGVDYDSGDRLKIEACDLEGNGTPGRTDTGAIVLRGKFGHATGFATVDLDGVWFEANHGQTMLVERNGRLTLAIRNTNWYADEDGRALKVAGIASMSIEDSNAPGGARLETWDIDANALYLKNVVVHSLVDAAVGLPTYSHVRTAAGESGSGRSDQFLASLTGVSGAPQAPVGVRQQGDEVELNFFTSLLGSSETRTCTVTGLPERYRPKHDTVGVAVIQDGGVPQPMACHVSASSGVITLGYGREFSRSGVKGVAGGQIRLRLL